MMKRLASVWLLTALFLGVVPASAELPDTLGVTAVKAASVSMDIGESSDHGTVHIAIRAIVPEEGASTLSIRVCNTPVIICSTHERILADGEYVLSDDANYGTVDAFVEGLGQVSLRYVAYDYGSRSCTDTTTGSTVVAAGGVVASATVRAGGTVGPWTIYRGYCAMNARDALIAWAGP